MPGWFTVSAIVALLLIIDGIYRSIISSRIRELIDNVPPFGVVSSEPVEGAEVFEVVAKDGIKLKASLHCAVERPRALILFCPELHGSHWTVANYGLGLIEAGFALLSFDVRNQGESEHQPGLNPVHWPTELELSDLQTVLEFVKNHEDLGKLPLGVYGISRGGSMALVAACRSKQIQSIVVDSAYDTMTMVHHFMDKFSRYVVPDWFFKRLPKWHVDWVLRQALRKSEKKAGRSYLRLAKEAGSFSQPALFISGKRDSYVTPDVTKKLADMLGRGENVWIVPKAKHNKSRSLQTEEYDRRLVEHFEQTLPSVDPATRKGEAPADGTSKSDERTSDAV